MGKTKIQSFFNNWIMPKSIACTNIEYFANSQDNFVQ